MFILKSRIFCLLMPSQQEVWRGTRSWEGTQLGQLTPTDQRDIPYHMTSCSAIKAGGKKEEGRMFGVMAFLFQVTVTHDGALLSWKWLNTCLPMGSSGCIPYFACLSTQLLLYRLCIHIVSITYFLIADFLLIPGTQPAPYISGDSFPVWLISSCSWYLSLKLCSKVLKKSCLDQLYPWQQYAQNEFFQQVS